MRVRVLYLFFILFCFVLFCFVFEGRDGSGLGNFGDLSGHPDLWNWLAIEVAPVIGRLVACQRRIESGPFVRLGALPVSNGNWMNMEADGIVAGSVGQFGTPRSVRFDWVSGIGVTARIARVQRGERVRIDVRISGRCARMDPRCSHRLERGHGRRDGHDSGGMRLRYRRGSGQTGGRIGRGWVERSVAVHHPVIQMRLIELSVRVVRSRRIVEVTRVGWRQRGGRGVGAVWWRSGRKRPSGIGGGGRNDLFAAEFPLGGEALQVGHEPHSERILHVHSFHGDHVTGNFSGALAEAHRVVIHGVLVRIVSQRIQT